MIDLHTHILPGMDDGATDPEVSIAMLQIQKKQGVDNVALTPHFYRNREEPEHFLSRRNKAMSVLEEHMRKSNFPLPNILTGAEVEWTPNMAQWTCLSQLCFENTNYMLLEMPFYPWNDHVMQQLYALLDQGIVPILAHLERYLKIQKKEYIQEVFNIGVPIQVNSTPLLHFMERRAIVKILKNRQTCIMASDCHNLNTRPPNLNAGFDAVERLVGKEYAEDLQRNAERILCGIV